MEKVIYWNGTILTMDAARPQSEALLTDGGVIEALGTVEALSALSPEARMEDLRGCTLMPGFIDGHSHLSAAALQSLLVNVSPPPIGVCGSLDDILKALKKALSQGDFYEGQWLIAMGYDESKQGRRPARWDLDGVSDTMPIAVTHASGHLCVVNTPAMAILGYTGDNFSVPEGGFVEEDGLLKEQAFLSPLKQALMKGPTKEQSIEAVGRASALYASYGYTTVQDARTTPEDLALIQAAGERGLVKTDVALYLTPELARQALPKTAPQRGAYANRIRPAGYKLYLDGSPQGKTAWLSCPYLIPPEGRGADYRGFPTQSREEALAAMLECIENHWQINVHANGDEAIERMISCYREALARTGSREKLRPVIIHCQTVREDQLEKMKETGILASFFLDHVYYWGDYHYDSVLGPERARRISPLRSALEKGVTFTIHQDTPVVPPNAMLSVHNAVNRVTYGGRVLGAEQRISALQAVNALTVNAAYQLFEENAKGILAPGKLADFTVLEQNPLSVSETSLKDVKVARTVKEGEVIYDAGDFLE